MEHNIKKIYLFLLFSYFSTFSLCNLIFGKKIAYFIISIMVLFIYIYAIKFIFSKNKTTNSFSLIIFLIFIYYIFVIINGIYFKNNARLIVGIYEYIVYSLPLFIPIFILYKDINQKYIEKILLVFLLINIITSLLAFYEYISASYIINGNSLITYSNTVRASVFNGSYLGLGAFIGQLSLANFYFIFNKSYSSFYYKFLFVLSFIINIIGIISTGSRGPLVATFFASILFIILYYIFIVLKNDRINKKIFGIMMIFLLVLIIFVIINLIISFNGKIENYYINATIYKLQSIFNWSTDESNIQRKNFWNYFFSIFKSNFLCGIGIGSTGSRIDTTSIGPTESGVLKRFVELGFLGGTIFYLILVTIFIYTFKYIIKNKDDIKIKLIVITLLSSVFVIFIDDITYQICEIEPTMFFNWFIYGMIVLIVSKRKIKR